MTPADIPTYARLFCTVFRNGDMRCCRDIEIYLKKLIFDAPSYDPAHGPMVQEDDAGHVIAIIGFIPLPVIACGREITARLGTAFLTDPQAHAGAAGRITTLIRAKRQDFIFSNTGAEFPARAVIAGGGLSLPLQSLDFLRVFRPLSALVAPKNADTLLNGLARALDRIARKLKPGLVPSPVPGLRVAPIARAEVLAGAPAMVERFAIRPRWRPEDLDWQLNMAAQNRAYGDLLELGIRDETGALIGIAICYARPGGKVVLLNLLTLPQQEGPALRALMAWCDGQGYASLKGEAQPCLTSALGEEPAVFYRFRGHFLVLTRHEDIRQALARGDILSGGLMGELWCRLVDDFR